MSRRHYPVDPSVPAMSAVHSNEMIEEENERLTREMANKVSVLKALSIDIGDEVRGQNTMLSDMGGDFDTTGSLLEASMKRVKGMAASGHNRWMCYMVLFILLVFLLLYYIIKWRGS